MVAANWPVSLDFVYHVEGGNDNDKRDHGGKTSRGITLSEWTAHRERHPEKNLPVDVWEAPKEELDLIYKEQYWEPYCDRMPGGIDLAFFQFCVVAGRQQAVKTLQKSLGVGIDGMMGIITWNAVDRADAHSLLVAYIANQKTFFRALKQFPIYGRGWLSRADQSEIAAAKLITAPAVDKPPPPISKPTVGKANPNDPKTPTVHPETGTGLSGILAMLSQFRDAIQNLTGIKHADYILFGIALVTFLISMYGFWQRNKTQEAIG